MATKLYFLLLAAICVLPIMIVNAREPFQIIGKVYCDACRAGFQTSKCFNIPDARVEIKCYDRNTLRLKYRIGGVTDSTGIYTIKVEDDHQDQICHAYLVSSPNPTCKTKDSRRKKATVVLTGGNGASSHIHYANAMGFLQDKPAPGCKELLEELLKDDA